MNLSHFLMLCVFASFPLLVPLCGRSYITVLFMYCEMIKGLSINIYICMYDLGPQRDKIIMNF